MIRKLSLLLAIVAVGFGVKAYHDTMRDPVIMRTTVVADSMDPAADPVSIALVADIHMAGPDMPPERVGRIVEQVNALDADMIVIAGDLVSEKRTATKHYSAQEIVAPLAQFEAPLGVIFVPGNHDIWFGWDALKTELDELDNVTIMENEVAQFGSLALGVVGDSFVDRADIPATMAQMDQLDGARVILTHSPDIFPSVPVNVDLVLAGHTHCGQIAYPWGGSPATMSDYGDLYACGIVEQHGKTLITSAGLGTSLLPIRLFTQPEIWLIEIRPPQRDAATADNS